MGGGHQINRGFKYLINNEHNKENSKLLCVVCNETKLKSNKNKIYKLFTTGFKNNTLCYINNLQNIIDVFFNSSSSNKLNSLINSDLLIERGPTVLL